LLLPNPAATWPIDRTPNLPNAQQHHFYGFGAAAKTAPATRAPHLHVQATGVMQLAEQNTKARQILPKYRWKQM
jgi:hypothetical protein